MGIHGGGQSDYDVTEIDSKFPSYSWVWLKSDSVISDIWWKDITDTICKISEFKYKKPRMGNFAAPLEIMMPCTRS